MVQKSKNKGTCISIDFSKHSHPNYSVLSYTGAPYFSGITAMKVVNLIIFSGDLCQTSFVIIHT